MIRALRVPLLLSALACAVSPALGWGSCAHRIVGQIAEERLGPVARAEVERLLGQATLADVAFWADRARETERYAWTRPLHYVNLPEGATTYDPERDCPEQLCIIEGIRRFSEELASREASRAERAVSLKFLVHLVADIHQPLHVSRASDLGGNLISVVHRGRRLSLHRLWDTELLDCPADRWRKLAEEIATAVTDEQIASWTGTDPVTWAMESWKLAHSHAYAVPASGEIDEAYRERNAAVVRERLAAAGVRLAGLLEPLLSTRPE